MIPESPLNQMLDAARHGRWKVVDDLIAAGTPVNELHPDTRATIIAMLAENLLAANEDPKDKVNAYFRVNSLIERGGLILWAIYGAALGRHRDLMEALLNDLIRYDHKGVVLNPDDIKQGLNYAVLGAARSGNRVLVNELLERGASLNIVVRGAALGRYRDWVMELVNHNASLTEAISAAAQAGDAALVAELFPRGKEQDMRRTVVANAAFGGHADLLEQYFSDNDANHIQTAFVNAARGGHGGLVQTLLLKVPEGERKVWLGMYAALGAAQGGHVALLDEYLGANKDSQSSLSGMIRGHQFDLMNIILQRNKNNPRLPSTLIHCAESNGYLKTEKQATVFLAKIRDPDVRKDLVRYCNNLVKPFGHTHLLLSILQRANGPMKNHGLSYAAAVAWEQNRFGLKALLAYKESDFTVIPVDVRERIVQHIVGVQNLSQTDAHELSLAVIKAYTGVTERARTAAEARNQEESERATRHTAAHQAHGRWFDSLRPKMKMGRNGKTKAEVLRNEDNVEAQTNALCLRRHRTIKPKNFLTRSMRDTMEKFPEFRNVGALRHWIKSCAEYLSTRFEGLQKWRGSRLEGLLPHLANFPAESYDPRTLAAMLQIKKSSPQYANDTVVDILSDQPYWNDLLALFPGVEQALVENLNDDPVSRLA